MPLPLTYNVRSMRVRWRTTLLAAGGIALVVASFAVLMAMSEGFAFALRATGRPDNAIVLERGMPSEGMSRVPLHDRQTILADERIARGRDGEPLASWEWLGQVSLPRISDGHAARVRLRGVSAQAFEVHDGVRVVAGRAFRWGLDEVIVGRLIRDRVRGLGVGSRFKLRQRELEVVGVFESGGAAFESEVWGDFDNLGARSKNQADSNCLVVRMKDAARIPELDRWLAAQPGMRLEAVPEQRYYEQEAGALSGALRVLAAFVAVIMGIGAVFGAMNTMYAIVAARTREIGTLRAVGFSRRAILSSFVLESALLALVGGVAGCLLASATHGLTTGTGATAGLREVAFAFRITPAIVGTSLTFAVAMGMLGGLLPALRAARLPIAGALRQG